MNSRSKVRKSLPKYRLHKPSKQAVVTLSGRDFYLGPHNSVESRSKYDRLIAEWLVNGRSLKHEDCSESEKYTISELIADYWQHVKGYYVKSGEPTSEQSNIRSALRPVRKLYGPTPADDFSPLALKAVRDQYVVHSSISTFTASYFGGSFHFWRQSCSSHSTSLLRKHSVV